MKFIDLAHRLVVSGIVLGSIGLTHNVIYGGWQIAQFRRAQAKAIEVKTCLSSRLVCRVIFFMCPTIVLSQVVTASSCRVSACHSGCKEVTRDHVDVDDRTRRGALIPPTICGPRKHPPTFLLPCVFVVVSSAASEVLRFASGVCVEFHSCRIEVRGHGDGPS